MEICATALFGYMGPFCSGCSPAARGSFSSTPMPQVGKDLNLWSWYSWVYLKAAS